MSKELRLSQPVATFIEATNNHDTDKFLVTLTNNAVITDEGQKYCGIKAIKEWSDEKYIGAKVTLNPVDLIDRDGSTILTAEVNGNFDKTGLPDPFLMDLHFTVDENKIAALSLRLAGE